MALPAPPAPMDVLNNNKEVVFDLDAAAFSSDDFRMYAFKVKRCPRARPHDWTQCPFAHPGEKAKRRDPRKYRYSGTACPEFRRNGCCRRGDACPFAHGVFECWLHPSRYRTQMCTDGSSCKRRVCFFAHTESELRKPEEDPLWLQQQLQAELAAEQQVAQQLQALKVFANMLGPNSGPVPAQSAAPPPADVLKNLPSATLTQLLGGGAPGQAAGAGGLPTQGSNSQLQYLMELVEKQQHQGGPGGAAQSLQSVASAPGNLAGLIASAVGGGSGGGAAPNSQADLQLNLAKQLMQQQQQAASAMKPGAGASNPSVELLMSLAQQQASGAAQQQHPQAAQHTVPGGNPMLLALQQLAAGGQTPGLELSALQGLAAASAQGSAGNETMALLLAAMQASGTDEKPEASMPAPRASNGSIGADTSASHAGSMDMAAAFLQAASNGNAPPAGQAQAQQMPPSVASLQGMLTQMNLSGQQESVAGQAAAALAEAAAATSGVSGPEAQANGSAGGSTGGAQPQALQQQSPSGGAAPGAVSAAAAASAAGVDDNNKMLMSLFADLQNKPDMLRNAKALLESLSNGVPPGATANGHEAGSA